MPIVEQHDDKKLLEKIAKGDTIAFKQFFDLYKRRLYVFVEQMIHSESDTEEIIQDTFLKIWQSAPNLLHIDSPGQYVYTIARNKTLNYIRKISREKILIQEVYHNQSDYDNQLEEVLQLKDIEDLVELAIKNLSPQKQSVYRMSRNEGLSHAEIAERMGLSQSRVKNILVEVLKYLRESLQKHSVKLAVLFWFESCYILFL